MDCTGSPALCSTISNPAAFCAWHGANGLVPAAGRVSCLGPECQVSVDAATCCKPACVQSCSAPDASCPASCPPGGSVGVNIGDNATASDWAVAELLTWSRALHQLEMTSVQQNLLGNAPPGYDRLPRNGLHAWYHPSGWDAGDGTWHDISGSVVPGAAPGLVAGAAGAQLMTDPSGASYVAGTSADVFKFRHALPAAVYTICSKSRYAGGALTLQGLILNGGNGSSWLHGHWNGMAGVACLGGTWATPPHTQISNASGWVTMCSQNGGARQVHVNGQEVHGPAPPVACPQTSQDALPGSPCCHRARAHPTARHILTSTTA